MLSARPRIDEMSARRCADMSTIRALSYVLPPTDSNYVPTLDLTLTR